MTPAPRLEIGFLMFEDMVQLDLTGPWEVLAHAPGAVCHLVAVDMEPVRTGGPGMRICPTVTLETCPQLDVIMVPGGPGHLRAMVDERLLAFLRRQAPGCRYVTAVCTGAIVLAAAGLLRGYRATTHWMSIDRLALFGAVPAPGRVVFDRNRVTGGGVTAGIDFGLALLAELADRDYARTVQLRIEYAPAPPFNDGSPDTAGPEILQRVLAEAGGYKAGMAEADEAALRALADGDIQVI